MVDIIWVSEVIGKPYYVRSADENVGGSAGVCFVLFNQELDGFYVVSSGGREARAGELIAFEVLVCADMYQHHH